MQLVIRTMKREFGNSIFKVTKYFYFILMLTGCMLLNQTVFCNYIVITTLLPLTAITLGTRFIVLGRLYFV